MGKVKMPKVAKPKPPKKIKFKPIENPFKKKKWW